MTNSEPASHRIVNTSSAAGLPNLRRLSAFAGAAVACGLAAWSQTPNSGDVGTTPQGIQATPFVLYRTQLFGANDLDEVKKIQAQYTALPLSQSREQHHLLRSYPLTS